MRVAFAADTPCDNGRVGPTRGIEGRALFADPRRASIGDGPRGSGNRWGLGGAVTCGISDDRGAGEVSGFAGLASLESR